MKVKKIACLLTALVISASAAMVPAVANAAAGEEVTVSSTTSYVEEESQSYDYDSAMGMWSGVTKKDSEHSRFGTENGYLKFGNDNISDCIMIFKTKLPNTCYYAFELTDGSIVGKVLPQDNAVNNMDAQITIQKKGTSTIKVKNKTASYTSKDGVYVKNVIVYSDKVGHIIYVSAPVTITPLKETTETVTAKEAASYTEVDEDDKIGFYGSANVNGTSVDTINWYAKIDGSWKSGVTAEVPTITAENSEVTFGLIINGDNAASTVTSAAYRLD